MTTEDQTHTQKAADASARIAAIKEMFEAIKETLRVQVEQFPEIDGQSPKALIQKLNDLQSAQVLLLKAEEAYYEKFGEDDLKGAVDHDAVRDQIGRSLDRIRRSKHPDSLP